MNRCIPVCLGVLLLTGSVAAQSAPVNADLSTFTKLQQEWADARKHSDMAFLERFYAEEFTVGNMNGGESSRAQDLAMFSSGDLKPAVIQDDQIQVHVYGNAALVTGLEHLEGTYRGHTGSFDMRFANTYVFRDGRWQIVRHQATQIPHKDPAKQ